MRRLILVAVQCALVLGVGAGVFLLFSSLRTEPATVEVTEQPIHVTVIEVQPENVPITVAGYGTVRNLNTVSIAPEVPGRLVAVHPRLERGEVIPKDEVLFQIDPSSYEQQMKAAEAMVGQLESGLSLLEKKHAADLERLKGIEKMRDLAKGEYDRVLGLFERKVGAEHGVELAEGALIEAEDAVIQVRQAIEAYAEQRREAENRLKASQAQYEQAKLSFDRTTVRAPFDARVKYMGTAPVPAGTAAPSLEVNQYVAPGVPVLTVADDSVLEISVPLDSSEARRWLLFDAPSEGNADQAWFGQLRAMPCMVKWTEDDKSQWQGELNRVEGFDERTRTLTVAIRLTGAQAAASQETSLPLVDGMFCEVGIPGRQVDGVYRVPRKAVNFDGTVYLANGGHLRTAKVEVLYEQGGEALISEGLKPGDQVIITRLVKPMENALLQAEPQPPAEPPA